MDNKIPWTKDTFKSSGIGLPKSDNPEILSVIVTRQDICCLAQFIKWAVMQEISKLLHRIAQFMNWALKLSYCCPFHELGNSAVQFMNWAISQIGRNIYTYTDHEVHKYSMTSVISGSSGTVDLSPKKSNTSSAVNISLSADVSCILDMYDSDRDNLSNP